METVSHTTTRWSIVISVLGIVVTLIGVCLTWYTSYRSTKQSAIESCIRRVDTQETLIREKGEALLGSLAAFGSKTAAPDIQESEFHTLGENVISTAMRFTAYSPLQLSKVAVTLAATIEVGLLARTEEEKERAIKLATKAMSGWTAQYSALMEDYASRRQDCLN